MGKHTFQSSAYLPSPYLPSNALANRHTANALITWGNKVEINVRTPRRGDAPPRLLCARRVSNRNLASAATNRPAISWCQQPHFYWWRKHGWTGPPAYADNPQGPRGCRLKPQKWESHRHRTTCGDDLTFSQRGRKCNLFNSR